MAFQRAEKIWFNGEFVDWEDAKVHVLSHVIHYGSSVFEGDRCYKTKNGPAIFRLDDHLRRLIDSCKIYRYEVPYSQEEIRSAIIDTIKVNRLDSCYIRPIIFRGYGAIGVDPFPCPVEMVIAVWEWGEYLGQDALEKGVDVRVSSWQRMAPNTFPAMAKVSANYMNAQLIKMEALIDSYIEGIALDDRGHVSEGSGENVFLVRDGVLHTPPLSSCILPGITRKSVITLAKDLGYQVIEASIPREALYVADELFFTGSAAEVTPIRSVDQIPVGNGRRGEITGRLQQEFFHITSGETEDRFHWLTYL